jgi:uncharacterized protein YicC (UPF0701 family)
VQTLTVNRADVNIRNDDGLTPLEMLNQDEKVNEIIKQYIENDKLKKTIEEEDKSNIKNEDEMNNKIIKQYIGNYIKLKKTIEEEDKSSIRELLKPKSQICLIL